MEIISPTAGAITPNGTFTSLATLTNANTNSPMPIIRRIYNTLKRTKTIR